jgi:hypothetical protein
MKVLGRSSSFTNLRAASNAKARVFGPRSLKIRQTTLTVRSGLNGGLGAWSGNPGGGRLRLGRLPLVFDTDFATRDQAERPHILADTILVYSDFAGLQIGDKVAVRIAHDDVQ